MQLTSKQIRHIAKLARINLTEDEVERFTQQLGGVIGYMEQLNKVDTEGVSETNQITGLTNSLRTDEVEDFPKPKKLIECSQNPIENNQIKVRKSI